MWKKAVPALLAAVGLSYLLAFLLGNTWPLPDLYARWNLFFNAILFSIISLVYGLSFRTADLPGLFLVVLVIRLLLCLFYVLTISFLSKEIFHNMALRFLGDFVIYTVADIWLASQLTQLKKRGD